MKNRKSKIVNLKWGFAALAFAFTCTSAFADNGYQYLYWYVDESMNYNTFPFAYAALVEGNSGATIDYRVANSYLESGELGLVAGYAPGSPAADLGEYANASSYFYVELFDANNLGLAVSTSLSYSKLYSAGYLGTSGTGTQAEHAWVVSAFMIPEPTSGMLFLLGIAALSLRRKSKLKK